MMIFGFSEVGAAVRWAACGGQSLHLHRVAGPSAPEPFRRAIAAGQDIAHLFDWDAPRLDVTARRLWVRFIKVERVGQPTQHVDLCGAPLRNAAACGRRYGVEAMTAWPAGTFAAGQDQDERQGPLCRAVTRTLRLLCRRSPVRVAKSLNWKAGWGWYAHPNGPHQSGQNKELRHCSPRLPGRIVEEIRYTTGPESDPVVYRLQAEAEDAAGRAVGGIIYVGKVNEAVYGAKLAAAEGVLGQWWANFSPDTIKLFRALTPAEFERRVKAAFGRGPTLGDMRVAFRGTKYAESAWLAGAGPDARLGSAGVADPDLV